MGWSGLYAFTDQPGRTVLGFGLAWLSVVLWFPLWAPATLPRTRAAAALGDALARLPLLRRASLWWLLPGKGEEGLDHMDTSFNTLLNHLSLFGQGAPGCFLDEEVRLDHDGGQWIVEFMSHASK